MCFSSKGILAERIAQLHRQLLGELIDEDSIDLLVAAARAKSESEQSKRVLANAVVILASVGYCDECALGIVNSGIDYIVRNS